MFHWVATYLTPDLHGFLFLECGNDRFAKLAWVERNILTELHRIKDITPNNNPESEDEDKMASEKDTPPPRTKKAHKVTTQPSSGIHNFNSQDQTNRPADNENNDIFSVCMDRGADNNIRELTLEDELKNINNAKSLVS